jgi:hypothetical protein
VQALTLLRRRAADLSDTEFNRVDRPLPALLKTTPISRPAAGLTLAAPRALESLTFRALDYGPPPDEHWVILGYRTRRGRKAEIRLP